MTQIYISSTYSDLVEHRKQVYDVLRKMRYDVIAMEDYAATDERPLDKCLADVAASHLYVGIFAWRYGYIPPGQERAITELEYRRAGEAGLERLIFLLPEDAPWPRNQVEKGPGAEKIEALRAELGAAHIVEFFHSPEELAAQVATAVDVWAAKRLEADMDRLRASQAQADERRREMRARQRVVNVRPLDVTHTFKDRMAEMRAMCGHLADAGVRLVSLVGRGGMGKTALASRVLADLERGEWPGARSDDFSRPAGSDDSSRHTQKQEVDGILYLSARSTGLGLERIYADAGRMLGEPTAGDLAARWADQDASLAAKVEALLEALSGGLYLILLDNLEDVLTAECEIAEEGLRLFVERCLTQPGGARLIATSREEVRLAGAALHGARCIPLRDGLPEDDAMALLRELDPGGSLGLRDAPEADLRRAARLTRGIPRALEMLAGILDRDPSASLARLLADERLFGAQVVEALVAEGYRRLGEDERRIMEALAVFDRPVADTAVAYLLHPWLPGLDAPAGLRRLAGGYFVSANRLTGEYSLHPLDREYAYKHLPEEIEGRDREEYTRRSLELRTAEFYASIRKPQSEWEAIDDLAPQLAEFEHRVRAGDYDGAGRVLEPADEYFLRWGYYGSLVEMHEKLVAKLADYDLQANNLGGLGRAYRSLGQVERAIGHYERALSIARAIGNRNTEGILLGHLGSAYRDLGQVERAIKLYEETLIILREIGDRKREGSCLSNLGSAYRLLGQVERDVSYHEKALMIAREIGDRPGEESRLGHMGIAYHVLGLTEQAIEFYGQALTIVREIGYRRHEVHWLNGLGNAYCALGQVERAMKCYEKALSIAREIGYRQGESHQLLGLGRALLTAGQPAEARQCCAEALALEMPEISYSAALVLGIALLYQGDAQPPGRPLPMPSPAAGPCWTKRQSYTRRATRWRRRWPGALSATRAGPRRASGAACSPRRWTNTGGRWGFAPRQASSARRCATWS
jgi:tetratricopeptide (TPR) repeat protein